MADKVLRARISSKNDSKTNWVTNNPTLLKGEIGIEFDPNVTTNSYSVKAKVGDGVNAWNDLPYLAGEAIELPVPDGTSIIDDNGTWGLFGFSAAAANTFPVKNASGNITWVSVPEHIGDLDTMYSDLASHIADTSNPHNVTKDQVGLGNVGNFKAVSTEANQGLTAEEKANAIANIGAMSIATKYGADIAMSIDSSTYVVTVSLKDQDGNVLGTAKTIDLPLESVVVSGAYDDNTKKVVLTLQNGSTIDFSVADLVAGLQTEITATNKLDADLVDDSTAVNKFVTAADKTKLAGIEAGAEVNVLESVSTADGALTITNKGVTIPTATAAIQGTVKGSTADNKVAVGNDGTMEVNSISTDKLFQGTDTLIFNCGSSS